MCCCVLLLRDICPILKDPAALTAVTDLFEEHVRTSFPQVDLIVGEPAVCLAATCLNTLSQHLYAAFWIQMKLLLDYEQSYLGQLPSTLLSLSFLCHVSQVYFSKT